MSQMRNLTEVEAVILQAILEHEFNSSPMFGEDIALSVHRLRGREIKYAVLYSALHRMTINGLVSATPGSPTLEHGAVYRKLHYGITDKGRSELGK